MLKRFFLLSVCVILGCHSEITESKSDNNNTTEQSYTKIIERISENDFQDSLIIQAEKIYPDRDSVLAVVLPGYRQYIPETGYWFLYRFDGILIPYAITHDAIVYYENLIDSLDAGKIYPFILNAEFEYHATISYKEQFVLDEIDPVTGEPLPIQSFENVYIVRMSLKWYHYCGIECGLWIDHQRMIIFDNNGNLLGVFFDGPQPVAVS